MSMVIISGRNSGYPCVAEVGEAVFSTPYPKTLLVISGEDYPKIRTVKSAEFSAPYPDYLMRILGSAVNDGYPCIAAVSGAERVCFSNLFFGEKAVSAVYFGSEKIENAYCSGQKVLGSRYEQKKSS